MAITLVTATPGGGKTALAVMQMKEAADKGRPVFVMGIPELKVPHFPVPPINEWTEQRPDPDDPSVMLPYFTFPENALIVLDEAQRVYRPRPAASKVPDNVAAFETHRHTGVDFILITQHPDFLDSNVRKLIGCHIHLRDLGVLGRRYYEWPEATDVKLYKSAPIKKKYKLPKESFSLYKSSSMHIKRSYTLPPVLVVFLLCCFVLLLGGVYIYRSINSKIEPPKPVAPPLAASSFEASKASVSVPDGDYNPVEAFTPRNVNYPESAPAYDGLRQVKAMPVIIGCVLTQNSCKCYTQQNTSAQVTEEYCRSFIKSPPFDPYRDVSPTAQPMAGDKDLTKRDSPSPSNPPQTIALSQNKSPD